MKAKWSCAALMLALGIACSPPEDTPVIEGPPLRSIGPAPNYPAMARMARISGEIQVGGTIDPEGLVTACEPIAGPPMLRSTAVAWVRQWTFEVPHTFGKPFLVKVRFRLADDKTTEAFARLPWCVTGVPSMTDTETLPAGEIKSDQ